ncbi:hypothetical protein R0K19_21140, partial [Bacillus sp. SIMBA_161]
DSKNTAQMFLPEADTQSPEFKAWFGNSTVINADGTPKLVFHGTRSRDNFNTFIPGSHVGTLWAAVERGYEGFPAMAISTAREQGKPQQEIDELARGSLAQTSGRHRVHKHLRIFPLYARIENPFHTDDYTANKADELIRKAID